MFQLPPEVLLEVYDHLLIDELIDFGAALEQMYDTDTAILAYRAVARRTLTLCDNERSQGGGDLLKWGGKKLHGHVRETQSTVELVEKLLELYDGGSRAYLIPRKLRVKLRLSSLRVVVRAQERIFRIFESLRRKGVVSKGRCQLELSCQNNVPLKRLDRILEAFRAIDSFNVVSLKVASSRFHSNLEPVANNFPALKEVYVDFQGSLAPVKLKRLPQTIETFTLKNGGLVCSSSIPSSVINLTLHSICFDRCQPIQLSCLKYLNVYNVQRCTDFISTNTCSLLQHLILCNIVLETSELELHKLDKLLLLEIDSVEGYLFSEIRFPPSLTNLIVREQYLPLIHFKHSYLPPRLKTLYLEVEYDFCFSDIEFPENLDTLVIKGGRGKFECENFTCPPFLKKLVINSQDMRNIHKLKLPPSVLLLDLGCNNIKRVSELKLPSKIERLSLRKNAFSKISNAKFPLGLKELDLTQSYPLRGHYNFQYLKNLRIVHMVPDEDSTFSFNEYVIVKKDYNWKFDRAWYN